MCETIADDSSRYLTLRYDPAGIMKSGDKELEMELDEPDIVFIHPGFLTKLNGKVLCKHPNTDWHEMDIKPGENLDCPAETILKLVLPEPYVLGSEYES